MKKLLLIFSALFFSCSLSATNYYTIDVNGTILWSTDGVSDCGCSPSNAGNNDSIFVYHGYTFPDGYFPSGDARAFITIQAPLTDTVYFQGFIDFDGGLEVNSCNLVVEDGFFNGNSKIIGSTVIFNDVAKVDRCVLEVIGSNVTCESGFDVFGNKGNPGRLELRNLTAFNVNGNVYGDFKGEGYMYVSNSNLNLSNGIIVNSVRIVADNQGIINGGSAIRYEDCYAFFEAGSVVFLGANSIVDNSEVDIYSNNVTGGGNLKIMNESVLRCDSNSNVFFPGSTVLENAEMVVRNGADVTFLSGVTVTDCDMSIDDGSIVNVTDAMFTQSTGDPTLSISGLLNLDSSTVITNHDMTVTSTGIIDMLHTTFCDFTGSKVNKKNASTELQCPSIYNPDENEFNIFENGAWSQGTPPNNVGVFAEIRDDYNSSADGVILTGYLYIEPNREVVIDTGDFISVTQEYNSFGNLTVRNDASLLFDVGTVYRENHGLITVQREGLASSMKYNIWSSPVRDTLGVLLNYPETNPCDMFVFEAQSQSWKYDFEPYTEAVCGVDTVTFLPEQVIVGGDGLMDAGRGYFMPGNDSSTIRQFTGKVNNGEIIQTVLTTNIGDNASWSGDDWNLIGNPYPSGLDLNLFWSRNATANNSLVSGIYFWVQDVDPPYDEFGSYNVWNYIGTTYYRQEGKVNAFDGVVPAGIGFWVVANDQFDDGSSIHDVEFVNTMRVASQSGSSTKHLYGTSDRHRMWINLVNENNHEDQILIGTHPDATDGVDMHYDAFLNYNGEPLILGVVKDSHLLTIAGYAPRIQVDTSEIELVIRTQNAGNHYLVIDSALVYLNSKRVFLLDKLNGTEEEMLIGDSILLDIDTAGVYDQRFYLKVTNSYISSVEETLLAEGKVWSNNNTILFSEFKTALSSIEVFDLRGVLISQDVINTTNGEIQVPIQSDGIYLVRFTDSSGNTRMERLYLNQ